MIFQAPKPWNKNILKLLDQQKDNLFTISLLTQLLFNSVLSLNKKGTNDDYFNFRDLLNSIFYVYLNKMITENETGEFYSEDFQFEYDFNEIKSKIEPIFVTDLDPIPKK